MAQFQRYKEGRKRETKPCDDIACPAALDAMEYPSRAHDRGSRQTDDQHKLVEKKCRPDRVDVNGQDQAYDDSTDRCKGNRNPRQRPDRAKRVDHRTGKRQQPEGHRQPEIRQHQENRTCQQSGYTDRTPGRCRCPVIIRAGADHHRRQTGHEHGQNNRAEPGSKPSGARCCKREKERWRGCGKQAQCGRQAARRHRRARNRTQQRKDKDDSRRTEDDCNLDGKVRIGRDGRDKPVALQDETRIMHGKRDRSCKGAKRRGCVGPEREGWPQTDHNQRDRKQHRLDDQRNRWFNATMDKRLDNCGRTQKRQHDTDEDTVPMMRLIRRRARTTACALAERIAEQRGQKGKERCGNQRLCPELDRIGGNREFRHEKKARPDTGTRDAAQRQPAPIADDCNADHRCRHKSDMQRQPAG